jgi:hypothetical protein
VLHVEGRAIVTLQRSILWRVCGMYPEPTGARLTSAASNPQVIQHLIRICMPKGPYICNPVTLLKVWDRHLPARISKGLARASPGRLPGHIHDTSPPTFIYVSEDRPLPLPQLSRLLSNPLLPTLTHSWSPVIDLLPAFSSPLVPSRADR